MIALDIEALIWAALFGIGGYLLAHALACLWCGIACVRADVYELSERKALSVGVQVGWLTGIGVMFVYTWFMG